MNFTASGHRKAAFKKGICEIDARRSRQETTVQLRKTKKEEQMMKKRHMAGPNAPKVSGTTEESNDDSTVYTSQPTITMIAERMEVFHRFFTNPGTVPVVPDLLDAVKELRRFLSVDRNPPVDLIIDAGALPYFVACLNNNDYPMLQFEAAWALTNIASTSRTTDVANCEGAVKALVRLLTSPSGNVREQAIWCIGNIAGDSVSFRDGILGTPDLIEGMVKNMSDPSTASLAQNVTWTVSNLCRGKPVPNLDLVKVFIRPLVNILNIANEDSIASETSEIRADAVWALSYLSDGDVDRIQAVVSSGAVPTLMQMVKDFTDNRTFMVPTVRCLGNFVTGNDSQTDAVIQAGFLDYATDLLDHQSKVIKKDTCWILSNIAAGNKNQISALFQNFESNALVAKLVKCAFDAPWEIRKEAVWAVCNILTCGTDRHMECVVSVNGIQALCNVLQVQQDASLLLAVMDAFEKLLEADENYERNYQMTMDECGGIDHLEELQQHPNNDVFEKASNIILLYFGATDDDEDQNLAPATQDSTFTFGLPSKELFPVGNDSSRVSFSFGGSSFNNV